MSFLIHEFSAHDGQPVALYEFRRGAYSSCYASCDQDITAGSHIYRATPISDKGVNQKGTAVTDVFEVTLPDDCEVAEWFRYTPPSDTIYIVVRRFHYGDSEAVIIWLGQVVSVQQNADDSCVISCQGVNISLKRGGLRLTWQRGCGHALYDQNCRAMRENYRQDGTITAVDDVSITVSDNIDLSQAYWPGGIVSWDALPGVTENRLIEQIRAPDQHVIYPFGFTDGFFVGQTIRVYPGCKRTSAWCDGYFNNIENYGGFTWMTNKSPYDGDPVF